MPTGLISTIPKLPLFGNQKETSAHTHSICALSFLSADRLHDNMLSMENNNIKPMEKGNFPYCKLLVVIEFGREETVKRGVHHAERDIPPLCAEYLSIAITSFKGV